MSRGEIYAAFDAIVSMEACGNFDGARKRLRSINREMNRRTKK